MSPIVGASAIQAGGSLLGGLFGNKSAKKQAKQDYRRQKEFAQNTIQWKVADAKKAGLHPLYALGASGSFTPSNLAGGYGTGDAIRDAAGAVAEGYAQSKAPPPGTPIGRLGQAQVELLESQEDRNSAEADLARSRAAREVQALNHTQDTQLFGNGEIPVTSSAPLKTGPLKPTTPSRMGGKTIRPDKRWSDAEEVEQRYGDAVSWLYGLLPGAADAIKAIREGKPKVGANRTRRGRRNRRSRW